MPPVTISGTQNELSLASFGPFFRGNMGIDAGIEEFGGRHADLMACSCQFVEGSIFGREWKPCWDSFTWFRKPEFLQCAYPVSYTHLRAHETGRNLVCRLLLEKKK